MVPLPNTPPQLNNPRIVSQNAFDVVLAVSATDVDGDLVTVSIDWGDGNSSRGRGVIYRHAYNNARFRVYRIQLRAEDTRGGVDTAELQVEITPPVIADINLDGLAWRPGCQITCAPGEHAYCRGASAGQQSSCECY
jgi:hypothetical protein